MRWTADAGEEGGLEKTGNAEGGGDEDDAQGWVRADEEVLFMQCQLVWKMGRLGEK